MSYIKILITVLAFAVFIAGCGSKPAQDSKAQALQVGILDMAKAIKGHPKYKQFVELTKQAENIGQQLNAEQAAMLEEEQNRQSTPLISQNEIDELNKTFEQEFNGKIAAKQEELSPRINAKADAARLTLSAEMDAYNEQIEKEYDPQILNLQLKLKTVQTSKDETATLQTELEKLQAQRAEALSGKQKELIARMDDLVLPEKKAVEQELTAYAKELNEEIGKKVAAKQAEIMARGQSNQQTTPTNKVLDDLQQQLVMKQKEAEALQGFIIDDIKAKTTKIGAEEKYEVVLTNVAVNVSGVDITAKVITECNK